MATSRSFTKMLVHVKSETERPEEEGAKKLCKDISASEINELLDKIKSQLRIDNVKVFEYFDDDFKTWVEATAMDDIPTPPKLRIITKGGETPPAIPSTVTPPPVSPAFDMRSPQLSNARASTSSPNIEPLINAGSPAVNQRNERELAQNAGLQLSGNDNSNAGGSSNTSSSWQAQTMRPRERSSNPNPGSPMSNPPEKPSTPSQPIITTLSYSSPSAFNMVGNSGLNSTSPWKLDPTFAGKPGWNEKGTTASPFKVFTIKEGPLVKDTEELKKVEYLFDSCLKGSLFQIDKAYAIQNESLQSQFELTAQKTKIRLEQNSDIFGKKGYKSEPNADWREAMIDKYNQYWESFPYNIGSGVKILPVAHGTQEASAWSICNTGFATLGWTDSGYFGKGLYFSQHAEYSALCYGDNSAKPDEFTILICWLAVGNPYPCIENPFEKDSLKGGGVKSGYDSHFTVVKPNTDDPNTKVYVPCEPNLFDKKKTFNEFVVFQEGQALPRYILNIKKKKVDPNALKEALTKKDEEKMKTLMRTFVDIYEQPPQRIKAEKAKWQNKDLICAVLECIDKYIDNAEMQFLLCSTFWMLSRIDEINRPIMIERGAIPLLTATMKKYGSDQPRLMERVCASFANIAIETASITVISRLGGVQPLISTLQSNMNHAYVVEHGCRALKNIADNASMQIPLAKQGCIAAAINALNIHKGHAGVQQEASSLIWSLTSNEQNRIPVAQQGGIQALLDALHNNKRVAEVQEYICGALWNVSVPKQNQMLVGDLGGITALLTALRQHRSHEGTVHRALGCLWNLAANERNQVLIAQAGGITDIILAMHHHKTSAVVCEFACACLWNLGVNDNNKQLILQGQGLTVVICAMGSFRDKEGVQTKALNALWNISAKALPTAHLPFGFAVNLDKEGRLYFIDHSTKKTTYDPPVPTTCSHMNTITIGQMGGINAVLVAMYRFPNNADIQEAGCAILRNLGNLDRNLSIQMCQLMAVQTVLKAMQTHKTNPTVLEMACRALHNLGLLEQNKPYLVQQGALVGIATAMQTFPENVGVAQASCGALWTLSVNDNNKELMFRAGIVQLVINILKKFSTDEIAQERALGVLWNLTCHTGAELEIQKQGGLLLSLQAIANFPRSESVNEPAVGVVWNMHFNQGNIPNIRRNKQLLVSAKQFFPGNAKIQEKVSKMLPKI